MSVSRRGFLASLIAVPVVAPVVAKALDVPEPDAPLKMYVSRGDGYSYCYRDRDGVEHHGWCEHTRVRNCVGLRDGDLVFWCPDHPTRVCNLGTRVITARE